MSSDADAGAGELTGASAIELASRVQRREVSPVEVVRAHLERIERLEPTIAAFQTLRAERALQDAEALEARQDLGELPLAGVPVAIKDNIDVTGEPTRQGSRATSAEPAQEDDELVRRLRLAGCIVILLRHRWAQTRSRCRSACPRSRDALVWDDRIRPVGA